MPGIPACELLDPRPAEEAAARGIVAAVNIPTSELPQRTHELPPKHRPIGVAAVGECATDALAWLRAHGRTAEPVTSFTHVTSGAPTTRSRLWTPSAFLAEVVNQLSPRRAFDVACGNGRDAVFLAGCGWDVTAADVLPDALTLGAALEHRYLAPARPIRWLQADFEAADGRIGRSASVKMLEFGAPFDLITVFRFLHRPLLPTLLRWLAAGGNLVCETFTTLHRERHGKPARDAHVLRAGELRRLAGPALVRWYDEGWREDGSHTARLWASRE